MRVSSGSLTVDSMCITRLGRSASAHTSKKRFKREERRVPGSESQCLTSHLWDLLDLLQKLICLTFHIFSCLLSSRSCSSEQTGEECRDRQGEGNFRSQFCVAERASVWLLGCPAWVRPLRRGNLLINWLISAAISACTADIWMERKEQAWKNPKSTRNESSRRN